MPHAPPPAGSTPRTATPLERLAGWALAAGVYACGLVWAAGQATARLLTSSWLEVGMADMPGVLARLAGDPGSPGQAWTGGSEAAFPGRVTFWGLALALLVVSALGVGLVRTRLTASRRQAEPEAAAWATGRQLRELAVPRPTPGRLTLGYAGRKLLAAGSRQSVIVIGPSQSGKTTGLAIPAILEWDGPVIATSVKADLLAATITGRRERGEVWKYDPSGSVSTGGPSARWTPLEGCGTWQGALRVASWLTQAAQQQGLAESEFWYATAAKLLGPLLFAAAASERTMVDVVRWVDTQEMREVRFELELAGVAEALYAAEASWRREERQRSSVYTTAETILRAFADPAVAASTEGCDVTADRLLDGGAGTLYVCAPSHEQARLRPLFVALLNALIADAYERAGGDQPQRKPLLIVLDEAANIAPLPDLDTIASTAAGVGIQLLTVWQDLAQIHTRYGERAATVVNNHRAKLALSGISDPRTLEYFSRLAGECQVNRTSATTDDTGRASTTMGTELRRLTPEDTLRRMRPGEGVLVYGALPPACIRLRSRQVAGPISTGVVGRIINPSFNEA